MKKTQLAGKTGLNYIVCLKYIKFMKMLSWIDTSRDDNKADQIGITEMGRQLIPVFSDYLEGKPGGSFNYTPSGKPALNGALEMDKSRGLFNSDPSSAVRKKGDSFIGNKPTRSFIPLKPTEGKNSGKERRILIVDDEPDALLTYKSFLTSEGYTVDTFENPERAFLHFASVKPGYYDLVITDIRMQEMNGLKLYQRIKTLDPSAKIIFVTALDAAEELVTILSPQPSTILRKPIEQQVFNSCVSSILSN